MQYQQLMLTRGFQSASEPRLHFGLDTLNKIDSILIVWPNQTYQVTKNIAANQQLTLKQADASGRFVYQSFFPSSKAPFEDVTSQVSSNWKHNEIISRTSISNILFRMKKVRAVLKSRWLM